MITKLVIGRAQGSETWVSGDDCPVALSSAVEALHYERRDLVVVATLSPTVVEIVMKLWESDGNAFDRVTLRGAPSRTGDTVLAKAFEPSWLAHFALSDLLIRGELDAWIDPVQDTRARLYYEAHVTVEPVFDAELDRLKGIAGKHGFRVADLLMQKRKADAPERSKDDTFLTARSKSNADITSRTVAIVRALKDADFVVWRYKIEDTMVDSRESDELKLLETR